MGSGPDGLQSQLEVDAGDVAPSQVSVQAATHQHLILSFKRAWRRPESKGALRGYRDDTIAGMAGIGVSRDAFSAWTAWTPKSTPNTWGL